jgi:endonuclease G, mitochondrial
MKTLIVFVLLFLNGVWAQRPAQHPPLPLDQCQTQAPWGLPQTNRPLAVICRRGYVTGNDTQAHIPAWTSWTLTPQHALGCLPRTDAFAADQSLPVGIAATPADYAGSGYDKGHVAPDGDMSWDLQVETESFLMTNMMPQLPGLNRGIWKLLETAVRGWAFQRGHTYLIYAGPVYGSGDPVIGSDHVVVPHAFFKIVLDTNTQEMAGFLFPHTGNQGNDLLKVRATVAQIQQLTGIQFEFPPGVKELPGNQLWPVDFGSLTQSKRNVCKQ